MTETYGMNPVSKKNLETICVGSSLKEITMAKCTEEEESIQYQGKLYVLENDVMR